MKEIKFKVWDKKLKKFRDLTEKKFGVRLTNNGFEVSTYWNVDLEPTYGRYCLNKDGSIKKMSNKEFNAYQKRFVILQYLGIKDINGKEIYEGDIVKIRHWRSYDSLAYDPFLVDFKNGHVIFVLKDGGMLFIEDLDWEAKEKVIGNIYRNPKLFK